MTTKVFHMAMTDNVLHLLALWYLVTYVSGQPDWFYLTCKVLFICYLATSFITIITFFLSNLPHFNQPKPPRNP